MTTPYPAPVILTHPAAIGDHRFAVPSGTVDGSPTVLLIDATDPENLSTTLVNLPVGLNDSAAADDIFFATGSNGLSLFDLGSVMTETVAVEVQIPANSGVEPVANSFNIEPDKIVEGADVDILRWSALNSTTTLTWESTVSNLKPGEVRDVALGAQVDFVLQTGDAGTIGLPPVVVVGKQILALTPASQTVKPGETASFTVSLSNPLESETLYSLSVLGVPPSWVGLDSSVTVPAEGSLDLNLNLTSTSDAPIGSNGFVLGAEANVCAAGSVRGTLNLDGDPVLPPPEPIDVGDDDPSIVRGVVVELDPPQAIAGRGLSTRYSVRFTNTGDQAETFSLSSNLPSNINGVFERTAVDVPAGLDNSREVLLTVTPTSQASPGNQGFRVTATSTEDSAVTAFVEGTITVAEEGVKIVINPNTGMPGGVFDAIVTNTGPAADVFDVALAGPLGPFANLQMETVSLVAGESATITIRLDNIDFAFPGNLSLVVTAASQKTPAVADTAVAAITIPETVGVDAEFEPVVQELSEPGPTTLNFLVHNVGNREAAYELNITDISESVAAAFNGPDGESTQTVTNFRIPGLSTGTLTFDAELTNTAGGTVTVTVASLTNSGVTANATTTL